MKTADTKTASVAKAQKANQPFFSKEGEENFFGKSTGSESSFFKPSSAYSVNDNGVLQTKLSIGQPNDKYEKEADAMADKIVQRLAAPESLTKKDSAIQAKPLAGTITPLVQTKCAACEKEEKLQKKEEEDLAQESPMELQRKPIFESNAEPPDDETNVQRKCEACEKEEKLQKKGSATNPIAPSHLERNINSSKGNGFSIPSGTKGQMENSFGTDFSKVRLHTDSSAVQMNQDLKAQAFTHGHDIYFNAGKYDTNSSGGKHLLSHELTHVVQQKGFNRGSDLGLISKNPDSDIQKLELSDIKYTIPAYWMYRAQSAAFNTLTSSLRAGRNDYFDIKGKTEYAPSFMSMMYIKTYLTDHKTDKVPVNVKYGNLGKGTIILQKGSNEKFTTTGKFLIGINHPALQVDTAKSGIALEVEMADNVISGSIGVPRARTGDFMKANFDSPLISYGDFHREDLYPVIFGEAYDGQNFTPALYINTLSVQGIEFQLAGYLDINHQHYIKNALVIIDDVYSWGGVLDTHITGTAGYELPIQRSPSGFLTAEAQNIQLDGQWQGQGFSLKAGLRIVYSKKSIEIYGNAEYKSKRAEGSVNIAVLPKPKAETLFRQHVPVKYREELLTGKQVKDDAYLDAPLALTAWGNFKLTLVDKAKKLTGSAAFAVSPEGYIVTAGLVKFEKDFILMDELNKEYILWEDEMSFPILLFGVPVDLSLRGDIRTGYKIGPVAMYEITASGVFSNHPDYPSELCIGAKFEMPGNLYGALNIVAAAAIRVGYKWASITVVEVGGRLNARADLNAFVNAKPSIGVREGASGSPEYCILGKLYAGGELVLSLDAGLEISLFRKIKTDDGKEEKKPIGKKDGFGAWTIGDFGFELGVDYTLGSDEKPDFNYTGKDFDKAGFKRAFKRNSGEVKPTKLKGGFIQEGKQKGVVDDESIKDKEVDQSGQPLGPFELVTDFKMNGTPHKLFLIVSGTEAAPKSKIEMASDREELIARAQEQIDLVEKVRDSIWMTGTSSLSADQEEKLEMEIARLRRIIARAQQVNASVSANAADPETPEDISAPGFEPLADEIEDLGDQFGVNDLGDGAAAVPGVVTPDIPTDQPPQGIDIVLVLPKQKSIYLDLYRRMVSSGQLQHSIDREERDTNQQAEWFRQIAGSMPRETFCLGRGLGLQDGDIFQPYWSQNYLDSSRKTRKKPRTDQDILRMQVDHVIEWQVRPLTGAPWLDQTWNYELLDSSSNGSSGPKMKNNIIKTRQDLVKATGDASWDTKDITFTKVVSGGDNNAERWSYEQIEDGDHLDAYRILTGEVSDPDREKEC